MRGARTSLRSFRQASILAVAVTGFLLLLLGMGEAEVPAPTPPPGTVAEAGPEGEPAPDGVASQQQPPDTLPTEDPAPLEPAEVVGEALGEARETAAALRDAFLRSLPQYLVAAIVLLLAWLFTRVLRPLLRRLLGQWERAQAITALAGVVAWLFALGIAVSVLVGDVRALVGSLGLIGLALSWALQNPIESFTGWLMNGMRGYYRVGDRIAVGEILGDVFRIDFFTTTVWEIGGPDRAGVFVAAEQPTGRLITFPNNEVLTGSIVNFTRDFPFVWDELSLSVGDDSDLDHAMEVLRQVADEIVGEGMAGPAAAYERILRERRLESSVPRTPRVFVSLQDQHVDVTVRYLVNARERRIWKSRLSLAATKAFNAPEHADRIRPAYPRRRVEIIGGGARPGKEDAPGERG